MEYDNNEQLDFKIKRSILSFRLTKSTQDIKKKIIFMTTTILEQSLLN